VRRFFAPLLLLALALPAGAAAKNPNAPVHVLWNSKPTDIRAGGTWDARISVMHEPGGQSFGHVWPVLVVTNMATGATQRIRTRVDIPPNTFKALVTFPRAGDYSVTATRFHPRHLDYTANIGYPVSVVTVPPPAPPRDDAGFPWWLVPLAAAAAAALAWATWRRLSSRRFPAPA
jgi:hypothetical protein